MSFRMRRGRTSFSIGPRGLRMSYRLGGALPAAFALVTVLVAACGTAGPTPINYSDYPYTAHPFTPAPKATEKPATARPATPAPPVAQRQVAVEAFGFTYYGGDTKYVQFGVVLRNPNVVDWIASDVRINITFLASDGTVAGSENERVTLAPPGNADEPEGRLFAVGGVSFVDAKVAEMTVTVTADLVETEGGSYGHAVFSKVKTTSDAYGTTTRGLVGSTYTAPLELAVIVAIYRDAAGKIVGGDTDYIDILPNEGTVSFEIGTLGKIPRVAKVDLYANP